LLNIKLKIEGKEAISTNTQPFAVQKAVTVWCQDIQIVQKADHALANMQLLCLVGRGPRYPKNAFQIKSS